MGCGMVRKVDELGRVVIPKEMRRILNIKSGSSIEMSINDKNQVVLEKFFELSNVFNSAENLANIIFDELNLPCIICDDEKVIISKGVNKKEYLNKKILSNIKIKDNKCEMIKDMPFLEEQSNISNFTYIFTITSEGFENGFLIILKDESELDDNTKNNIILLTKFLSTLLTF